MHACTLVVHNLLTEALAKSREPTGAAMSVISLRGLYRPSGAEHNLKAEKVQELD
jgi:hypothetical protein